MPAMDALSRSVLGPSVGAPSGALRVWAELALVASSQGRSGNSSEVGDYRRVWKGLSRQTRISVLVHFRASMCNKHRPLVWREKV